MWASNGLERLACEGDGLPVLVVVVLVVLMVVMIVMVLVMVLCMVQGRVMRWRW